jgi:4'-phosphopantetheinyl transferase EntD
MMEDLLPSCVISVECRDDDPHASLLPEECAQLGRAVESRVREFATARWCARRALGQLGLPPTPILRGPDREPLWPSGVVGSITHCSGYRAAAVSVDADVLAVGIDAEVDAKLPADVLERVCVEEEIAWVARAPVGTHWDRVLFSVKESIYKAWFPLTHRWLDFEDVSVTVNPAEGSFRARLLIDPPAIDGRPLVGFAGRFLVGSGLVLTATTVMKA